MLIYREIILNLVQIEIKPWEIIIHLPGNTEEH